MSPNLSGEVVEIVGDDLPDSPNPPPDPDMFKGVSIYLDTRVDGMTFRLDYNPYSEDYALEVYYQYTLVANLKLGRSELADLMLAIKKELTPSE